MTLPVKSIIDVSIFSAPPLAYITGNTFNSAGGAVVAVYDDGTSAICSTGISWYIGGVQVVSGSTVMSTSAYDNKQVAALYGGMFSKPYGTAVTVMRAPQSLTFSSYATSYTIGASTQPTISASCLLAQGNAPVCKTPIMYYIAKSTPAGCVSIDKSSGRLTLSEAGNFVVVAAKSGDSNHDAASPVFTSTITVMPAQTSIRVPNLHGIEDMAVPLASSLPRGANSGDNAAAARPTPWYGMPWLWAIAFLVAAACASVVLLVRKRNTEMRMINWEVSSACGWKSDESDFFEGLEADVLAFDQALPGDTDIHNAYGRTAFSNEVTASFPAVAQDDDYTWGDIV
jgi:hypothetical protein